MAQEIKMNMDWVFKFLLTALNTWLQGQDLKIFVDMGIDQVEELVNKEVPEAYRAEAMALVITIRTKLGIPDYPDK